MGITEIGDMARSSKDYWTASRTALLKELWRNKVPPAKIAAALGGGITSNGVVGKAHRLGLSDRKKQEAAEQRTAEKEQETARRIIREKRHSSSQAPDSPEPGTDDECDMSVFEKTAAIGTRCSLMELRDGHCRWPIGDPGDKDFSFCGGKTEGKLPYCSHHARIAYKPAVERQRRKRAVI